MIPIIYPNSETAFTTRGYGALSDCISCSVTEELNGAYTLELKYPNSGINAEYLQPRNIIVCKPNWSEDREAFRIYKVTRAIKNSITVYANQLSYDLSGFVVLPGTSTSLAAAITKLSNAATGFTISTTKSSSTDFIIDVPSSVRSWFGGKEGSLIDLYGGEWKYSFWTCQLLASRGADNGLRISYGVNLAEYQKELDDNKYSKVLAFFSKEIDNVKTVIYGTAVSTGATGTDRTLILDATSNWNDTVPTAANLTTYATNYISSHSSALKNHKQTITITPEVLATQEITMGDTVHVIYEDEIVSTRVIKTVWDVISDRFTTVELGTKKTNISETIKSLNEGTGTPSYQNLVRDVQVNNTSVVDSNRAAKLGLAAGLGYTASGNIIQLKENSSNVYPQIAPSGDRWHFITNASATTVNIAVPNSFRGLLAIFHGSDTANRNGLYMVVSTTGGTVFCEAIKSASGATITKATNKLTITTTVSMYIFAIGNNLLTV